MAADDVMLDADNRRSALASVAMRLRSAPGWLADRWQRYSLAAQFTLVAAIVIGITMTVLGGWVSSRIENGVVSNTAAAAALYMDRFIEPHVQALAQGGTLPAAAQQALSELITTRAFGQQIATIKIWRPDGTIVYSNHAALIGTKLPISDSFKKALAGAVVPEFNLLDDEENAGERGLDRPLLEIYAPLLETNTERIIGVAEFYQLADNLHRELTWGQFESAAVVTGLGLLMLGALSGIVGRGSRTIAQQQQVLNARIADLSQSLALNEELRQRVADANRRSAESSEQFLRRVSAELHDGPVQLIGLVLLRLDGISVQARVADPARAKDTLEVIRGALRDSLAEIRGLSNGFALPELEHLRLEDALELAISNHERRSSTVVGVILPEKLPDVPIAVKACVYRFVQEGLNNAFRHAGGIGQSVVVGWNGTRLAIEVSDRGPGLSEGAPSPYKGGIGLSGMRDRIESLGGIMNIETADGQGTRLRASFHLG